MAHVSLQGLTKRFGSTVAVDDLSLEIADKAFVTLVGPSGCGKTTTLRLIAGLERPTTGQILFDGEPVEYLPANHRDIAMVFQSYALYPHLNVFENMAFPLRMMKVKPERIKAEVVKAAKMLGIEEFLTRKPRELSGGQRQRVALGRAIVREPAVFLMDEPLSNLDAKLRVAMRVELKRLHLELKKTFIYVTHDQAEAMTMSDQIAVMEKGKLQQYGSPREIYERPKNLFVAGFIGSPPMNFIYVRLLRYEGHPVARWGEIQLRLPKEAWPRIAPLEGKELVLGIRPEAISLQRPGKGFGDFDATVYIEEPIGSDLFVTLEAGGVHFIARTSPDFQVGPGAPVKVSVEPKRLRFFDPSTTEAL